MKKTMLLILLSSMLLVASTIIAAAEVEDYSSTINVFRESPVVAGFFKNSYGYAVFPAIVKAGYVVGGSYGKGQVYRNGKVTGKTSVLEGSIGLQIGGEAFSEIIFFQDKRAYDNFISGNFEFDATAQAVVVTAGAQVQAETTGAGAGSNTGVQAETDYIRGMATFVYAKSGLMIELSLGGQKFTFEPL